MRAFPSWAAIREADRLDRSYGVAERRGAREPWSGRLFLYAVPTLPLIVHVAGGDVTSRWWAVGVGLVAAIGVRVVEDRVARRTPFEALRFPDPSALLVARFVRQLPWLMWTGSCLGLLRALQFSALGTAAPALSMLGAVLLATAPVCFLAVCVTTVVAESLDRRPTLGWRRGVAAIALALAMMLSLAPLDTAFDLSPLGAVFVFPRGGGAAAFVRRNGRLFALAASGAWLVGVASVACGTLSVPGPRAIPWVTAELAVLLAFAVMATPLSLRWSARQRPVFDKRFEENSAAATETAGETEADEAAAPSGPIARARPGVGLWAAAWRWRWLHWRKAIPTVSGARAIAAWLVCGGLIVPISALWFGRSALGAAALVLFSREAGTFCIPAAAAIALLAPSLIGLDEKKRLFLLGVEARDLELHELRAYFGFGALPALAAGAAAASVAGFGPASGSVLTTILAFALLRHGWAGLLGRHAATTAALALLVGLPAVALWGPSPEGVLPWASAGAAVGLVGLALRLSRASERSLRETLRG